MTSSVSVLLFGITRDMIGLSEVSVLLGARTSVGDLVNQLQQKYPALVGIRSLLVAVNGEYAETELILSQNDEVALIPPVSGG